MTTTIKFAKVNPNAIIPSKIEENIGLDFYACFDAPFMVINPNETKMIDTGIAFACDKNYGLILKERSSTGLRGMSLRSGLIDSGFRESIRVLMTNINTKPLLIIKKEELEKSELSDADFIIYPYEKAICQGAIIPVPEIQVEELKYEDLLKIPSVRGTGMLGSSNK